MADKSDKYPQNIPGAFFVDRTCINCDLCRQIAPNNFTENQDDGHSYVYKQPVNEKELDECNEAMEHCPTESIGNDGK